MKFFKNQFLFLVSLFITLIITGVLVSQIKEEFFPEKQIQDISSIYNQEFEETAAKVETSLSFIKDQIDSLHFVSLSVEEKAAFLIKYIQMNAQIHSLMILEHNGRFSILQHDQNSFVFTSDSSSKIDNVKWYRLDKNGMTNNSWTMALGLELNVLTWGEEVFNKSYQYKTPLWGSSGRILGLKNGSLASHISWRSDETGQLVTCIAVLDSKKLSVNLPRVMNENFQSFIVNLNDQAIPFQGRYEIKNDTSNSRTAFHISRNSWEVTGKMIPGTFSFIYEDDVWWGQSNDLNIKGLNASVLSVNEAALYYTSFIEHIFEILIITFFSIMTMVFFMRGRRRKHLSLAEFVKTQNTDKHASELVNLGENDHLEFKSSFRYDYQLNVVNKELEGVIAKSIAAFSNASGGTLLIGVDDDGNVLGLEKDINTLKRKDLDFFENTLRTFLNKTFSVSFVTQNLEIKFPVIAQKAICRINIIRSNEPVFIEIAKKNTKSERFYLRSGNTSQEITSLREINDYIKDRFSND